MVKNQKKKAKQNAVKKVKKTPVQQIAKSTTPPSACATKSRKGLIFKIVIWTLTILFFGGIITCLPNVNKGPFYERLVVTFQNSRSAFFIIQGLGIILWSILLFFTQEKTRKIKIVFGVFIASIIFGIISLIMQTISLFCISISIYVFSPIILALKPKKVLWYLFYLLLGLCYVVVAQVADYITRDVGDAPHDLAKPIIYLHPEQKTDVSVKVGYPEKFTHTYPHYTNGWFVEANPNGDLVDKTTGRNLYALYWEGKETNLNQNPTEGFVVAGKDTISFLEEKLAKLGLSEREADEFIIYWLPKLEDEKYNFIRFQTKAEQDTNMPLLIEPKPDTVIRVMMEYDDLDEPIEVQEQILPQTPVRTGFTVVEWGGTELDVD